MGEEKESWLFIVLALVIMGIGTVGNVMVIIVIFNMKDMRNSTNVFLANLAISDLIFLVIVSTKKSFDLYLGLNVSTLNELICKGIIVSITVTVYASVLTIIAIGIDRYYAVCQPLKASYICTKKRAYRICLLVWAIALVFSNLRLSFLIYLPKKYDNGAYSKPVCEILVESPYGKTYLYITTLLFFFLPLIILLVLFLVITRVLRRAEASSVITAAIRHRRQVITMLATVCLVFFLCHLPYRMVAFLITVKHEEVFRWLEKKVIKNLVSFCKIMIYIHSAINPILYNFMSKKFRAGFKSIVCDMMSGFCRNQRYWCFRREATDTTTSDMTTSSV